jgi:hypothetical protein
VPRGSGIPATRGGSDAVSDRAVTSASPAPTGSTRYLCAHASSANELQESKSRMSASVCKGSATRDRAWPSACEGRHGMTVSSFQTSATAGRRDSRFTNSRNTVMSWLRIATAFFALAACGSGSKQTDTYARATDVQGKCCENLAGAGRDSCLKSVVRIEDAAVASTSVNQQTYACVVDHFVCDPGTGKPTQPSAQAQLECIQDLQQ